MNRGKAVFAQLLAQVPFSHFEHLVDVYQANKGIRHFSAWNQFLCLMYAQLTRRSGLRDLVACLNAQRSRLYHIGLRGPVTRSTLADANERRDYRLFEALGQRLIASRTSTTGRTRARAVATASVSNWPGVSVYTARMSRSACCAFPSSR